MTKTITITLSILLIIISTLAFTVNQDPHYKNLQILPKDISKEKLDSIMHHFSMSLNVRCNFCHLKNEADKKWDFASDSMSDKLIARKMMLMTMDINKKYFTGEEQGPSKADMVPSVTCYTCHHGSTMPTSIPPPPPPKPIGAPQQPPKTEINK